MLAEEDGGAAVAVPLGFPSGITGNFSLLRTKVLPLRFSIIKNAQMPPE